MDMLILLRYQLLISLSFLVVSRSPLRSFQRLMEPFGILAGSKLERFVFDMVVCLVIVADSVPRF